MGIPKNERSDPPKYELLEDVPVDRQIYFDEPSTQPRPCSASFSVTFVFVMALLLGFYIGHVKLEVHQMIKMIQENRYEISELRTELARYRLSTKHRPVDTAMNQDKNVVERYRRNSGENDAFIAAHLIGIQGRYDRRRDEQVPQTGDFFQWSDVGVNAFSLMEVVNEDAGTFIVINKDGYYHIYSQVVYHGQGLYDIGHETVCVKSDSSHELLMASVNTQQMASSKGGQANRGRSDDSGFHSGVFYLYAGDKIGVKPVKYGSSHHYIADSQKTYFGVYFLHE